MAATKDILTNRQEGILFAFPVYQAVKIYAGTMVCIGASHGYAIPGADAAGNIFVGIAAEQADNSSGNSGDIWIKVWRKGIFELAATSITQAMVGDPMYVVDDQTFDETSPGNSILCGRLVKRISATRGLIDVDVAVPVALAAGGTLTITDAGGHFTTDTVEAALAQLAVGAKTAQYVIQPAAITLETGAPTAVFANAGADGFTQLTNKEVALRWNNGANPTKMAARFIIPPDLDPAADIVVHFLGAIIKAGGAEADSPTITCEAYFAALGAAMLADANCGGVSGEFLTAQADKWQEKTLAIALADIPAVASVLTLIFNPTDGELPADDFALAGVWLEVTRRILTA
jgi:hypothetical protein